MQQLVDHVLSAGAWLEAGQANRDHAADLVAAPDLFNQSPGIIRHVLSNPRDRVTYADLRLVRSELDDLMEAALDASGSRTSGTSTTASSARRVPWISVWSASRLRKN